MGILLPASVGGSLVNLAATLAGKTVVNLNFTTGRAGMESAAAQAGLQTVVTSRAFLEKAKLEPPRGVELILLEDVLAGITPTDRLIALALAILAPARVLERVAGAARPADGRRHGHDHLQQRQHGRAQGRGPLALQHRLQHPGDRPGLSRAAARPADRHPAALPLVRLHDVLVRANTGMGTVCHPSPLDAATIGALVERYRVTILLATPTFLQLYMRRCTPAQFGSIRLILAGAEKLPEQLALAFEDTFGIRPMEGYGLTECSPVVAVNTFDWREPGFFQPGSRRGYVGQPLPGVSVRIVSHRDLRAARARHAGAGAGQGPERDARLPGPRRPDARRPSTTAGTSPATRAS